MVLLLCFPVSMAGHALPTLLQLAKQTLLREDTLVTSALEDLLMNLLPVMFKEIFTDRSTKILKAIVAAWPFPCLPIGALMDDPPLETLKALLQGLDVLITQKVCPR